MDLSEAFLPRFAFFYSSKRSRSVLSSFGSSSFFVAKNLGWCMGMNAQVEVLNQAYCWTTWLPVIERLRNEFVTLDEIVLNWVDLFAVWLPSTLSIRFFAGLTDDWTELAAEDPINSDL